MNICAVVLCGGESRRMGSDKALLRLNPDQEQAGDQRRWAERACDTLTAAGLPVALSIRASQREVYTKEFPGRELIADDGAQPGPLGALLSVYRARRQSLFILAADMPFVSANTVRLLLARFAEIEAVNRADQFRDRAPDVRVGGVCFGDDRRIEPLCAIYAADALAGLDAHVDSLERFDLQQLRSLLRLKVFAPATTQRRELHGLNSPLDLRAAGVLRRENES